MYKEGADEVMDDIEKTMARADPDMPIVSHKPMSDVDKARAKKAYDTIQNKIEQRDLNSDNLFEDMLSEKAYELERVSIKSLTYRNFLVFGSRKL